VADSPGWIGLLQEARLARRSFVLLYAVAMQVFRASTVCRRDSQQLLLLLLVVLVSLWHVDSTKKLVKLLD
jgi:hypothetical protein